MRSRVERNKCEKCSGPAKIVHVRYTWQYVAGAVVVLAGAVFMVLPQVSAGIPWEPVVATLELRLVWLFVFVGFGYAFASWGVKVMKANALAQARSAKPEAEA